MQLNDSMSTISAVVNLRTDRKALERVLLVGGIAALALVLRLFRLGDWSFWIDEMITVEAAQGLSAWQVTEYPAFLALVGAAMGVLGTSEWSARVVPALFGVVTVPALYLIARRMFGERAALVACLLLAVSPWHLYWSQNARFYTILLLVFTAALFAFHIGLEDDRPAYLIASGALLFLAARERLFALFLVPIVGLYLALVTVLPFDRPRGLNRRNIVLLAALGGGVALMFSFPFLQAPSQWTETFDRINTSPLWLASGVAYYVGVATITLAAFAAVYLLRQRDRVALLLSIAALLPLLAIMGISLLQYAANRYVFMTLPCYLLLAGVAVAKLREQKEQAVRLMGAAVLAVLVVTSLSEVALYFHYQNGNRDDWKGAVAVLAARAQPGDLVVSADPRVTSYYLGRPTLGMQGLDVEALDSTQGRVWLIEDMNTGQRFPEIAAWIERNANLVADLDVHVRARTFKMRVYSYDPSAVQD